MLVHRQVIGGERDVVGEQEPEPARQRPGDAAEPATPDQAVVNDDQVGRVIRFAVENADKISFVSFQPVSFTGRDEDIDDATRGARRYTLSHLAHDVRTQTGALEPLRDWFPLSAAGAFADVTDVLAGPGADWGTLKCGCHPNCGIATALMVNKRTKTWAPLTGFFDAERFFDDARAIADSARGPRVTKLLAALSLWAGPDQFVQFLLVTALTGGALSLLTLWYRRWDFVVQAHLAALGMATTGHPAAGADAPAGGAAARSSTLPYGVAIAVGGIAIIVELAKL